MASSKSQRQDGVDSVRRRRGRAWRKFLLKAPKFMRPLTTISTTNVQHSATRHCSRRDSNLQLHRRGTQAFRTCRGRTPEDSRTTPLKQTAAGAQHYGLSSRFSLNLLRQRIQLGLTWVYGRSVIILRFSTIRPSSWRPTDPRPIETNTRHQQMVAASFWKRRI